VKKERFKEIVNNYTSTSDDISSLKKLASDYPFSQIVHLLLANAAKKSNLKEYKPTLSSAAFHTTDRGILKSLIEHNLVPSEIISTPAVKNAKKAGDSKIPLAANKKSVIDSDLLIAEVLGNLEKLQILKKEAYIWLEEKTKTAPSKSVKAGKKSTDKTASPKKKPRVKTQTKIIEKFIKEEPRITQNAAPANDKQDMAKKSGEMRDDIISESLAKIFITQGKKEKAIDIYKKLIWKFPQKKALFAAQIEKLKKK